MIETEGEEYRTGVWPTRPMSPFEPPPAAPSPQRSRARSVLKIAWVVIVLALLSVVAFVLARVSGQI
jgi:hypothetical protein